MKSINPIRPPIIQAILVTLMILIIMPGAHAELDLSKITDIEINPVSDEIELIADGAIEYGYFPLSEPDRLVFDFPGTLLEANDGVAVTEDVEGACFSQVRLSQFSEDPPITRLVVYLGEPSTATVSYSPISGRMVITVNPDSSSEPQEFFYEAANTTNLLASSTTPAREITQVESTSYNIEKTADELILGFPGVAADDIEISKRRFPDRLHVRLFTRGDIGSVRPRFDPYERGNIWNAVAKQWSSFRDRDGLGVVDLTFYLYPNVGYTQSVDASGVSQIRLYKLEPAAVEEMMAESEEEVILAVSSFGSEPGEETTECITEIDVLPEGYVEPETDLFTVPERAAGIEEITEAPEVEIEIPAAVIHTTEETETIEIIDNAVLVTGNASAGNAGVTEITPDELSTELGEEILIADSGERNGLPAINTVQRDILAETRSGEDSDSLYMKVGEVVVMPVQDLVRASIGNPQVATLNVISQYELLVTALTPGTTTLMTWEQARGHVSKMIYVLDATEARENELADLIGNDDISVSILMMGADPGVILEGMVRTEEEMSRAGEIAALYAGERVTNLIEVTDPRQVLVKVRVVEIDKRALDEHLSHFSMAGMTDNDDFSFNIITDLFDPENPGGGLIDTRTRPGIVNGEAQDMIFDPIDAMLNELESNRNASVLSEPNLVTMSGHTAHFRVGGEIPYTYQNENGFNVVDFREFGIQLDMTPSVDSSHNIYIEVTPTVRTVDMALAIAGIPGFRTREIQTDVQLKPGETLVIGGLLQSEITEVVSEIPILAEIPILGELFKSRRFTEDETELVIFLTPYLIGYPEESEEIVGLDPQID